MKRITNHQCVFFIVMIWASCMVTSAAHAQDNDSMPICIAWDIFCWKVGGAEIGAGGIGGEEFEFSILYWCLTDEGIERYTGYVCDLSDATGSYLTPYSRYFSIYGENGLPVYNPDGTPVQCAVLTAIGDPVVRFAVYSHAAVGGLVLTGPINISGNHANWHLVGQLYWESP